MAVMTWSIRFPMHMDNMTIGLDDVLAGVPDNNWNWRLWDLYGMAHAPHNMSMEEFESVVREAPSGYSLPWTDLLEFARRADQIYDCLLTAAKSGYEPTEAEVLGEDYRKLIVVISAEDSTYWALSSNLDGMKGTLLHRAWESLARGKRDHGTPSQD
jgi:hypothetical protein